MKDIRKLPNFKSKNRRSMEKAGKMIVSGIIGIGLAYAIPRIKDMI